ncbi:MAG: PKD domain-containing protein [Nanoarchaeota archaeon]|nr:PKD domain-containing protein [Nanoarchaeota archaeon]
MKKLLLELGLAGMLMFSSCEKVLGPEKSENYLPVVQFTQSATTIYLRERIEFNASSSYGRDAEISKYIWNFDDGIIGFGKIKTHTYNSLGKFHPSLTIQDSNGNENIKYGKTITVLPR